MVCKGSFFKTGDHLRNGDYLLSPNNMFCAYMNDDGNFCIYRGQTPNPDQMIWASGKSLSKGSPHCAFLHGDGNLCIYNSQWPDGNTHMWASGPTGPQDVKYLLTFNDDGNLYIINESECGLPIIPLWSSNVEDPVIEITKIKSIDYDIDSWIIQKTGSPAQIFSQTVENKTDLDQTSSICGSVSVANKFGWFDLALPKDVEVANATVDLTHIPKFAEGKIHISPCNISTFIRNGSTINKEEWGFNTPVHVPAQSKIVCSGSATTTQISVPFTLYGTGLHQSGNIKDITICGIYEGTYVHDFKITFSKG